MLMTTMMDEAMEHGAGLMFTGATDIGLNRDIGVSQYGALRVMDPSDQGINQSPSDYDLPNRSSSLGRRFARLLS